MRLLLFLLAATLSAQQFPGFCTRTYTVTSASSFPSLPYPAGSLIAKNGVLQTAGTGYTFTSSTFQMNRASLNAGDQIQVISICGPKFGVGVLKSIPASCSSGDVYIATDQPALQQLYVCGANNSWSQQGVVGPSGGLMVQNGALDLVPAMIPFLFSTNVFTGYNQFAVLQVIPNPSDPGCKTSGDVGKQWINNSDPNNTAYTVCLSVNGTIGWVAK